MWSKSAFKVSGQLLKCWGEHPSQEGSRLDLINLSILNNMQSSLLCYNKRLCQFVQSHTMYHRHNPNSISSYVTSTKVSCNKIFSQWHPIQSTYYQKGLKGYQYCSDLVPKATHVCISTYPIIGPPRSKLYTCLGLRRYLNFLRTLEK